MRNMIDSLLKSVNKISEIDQIIAQIDNKERDKKFADNMRSVIGLLLKSVDKISEINQKIAQIDKVTTYPYRINTFKVCESEMLSKNEMNRLDEDKSTPKNKDKTKDKDKTKTKTVDKDKNIPKTKTVDKDKNKTESEYKFGNVYFDEEIEVINDDDWILRKIVIVSWNNNYASKLYENWAFYEDKYVYTRFEKLYTFLGEELYTGEDKATLSK